MKKLVCVASVLTAGLCIATSARANNIAYAGSVTGAFGTMDLNTGAFTSLGNSGQTLAGMAVANGLLFATSYHTANGTLFTVNPATGALTSVGTATGIDYDDFGATTSGLYVVGTNSDLYSIDPSTGAATLIGPTGLSLGFVRSLSDDSNTLYFSDGLDLYTLNTSTGAATQVGAFGDSVGMSVMVMEGGILYGADYTNNTVDTINVSTGVASVGSTSGAPSALYGLAPNPIPAGSPTPEPGTWALLVSGITALVLLQRRRYTMR